MQKQATTKWAHVQPNLQNLEKNTPEKIKHQETMIITSSGRIVRQVIKQEPIDTFEVEKKRKKHQDPTFEKTRKNQDPTFEKTRKNQDPTFEMDVDIKPSVHDEQTPMRRIKPLDADKTFAPDLSKIGRYLMAVRNSRVKSLNQLANEETKSLQAGEPELAQLWSASEHDQLFLWKRVDDLGPSLSHWTGKKSIDMVVHGSVPKEIVETVGIDVEAERRPLPVKIPGKRGRPRKEDVEKRRLLAATEKNKPPPPPLINEGTKLITVNECLHSLVDGSIAGKPPPPNGCVKTSTSNKPKAASHGGIDLPITSDEEEHLRLAVFSGHILQFDVDKSPLLQSFESIQITDLFRSLPEPEPHNPDKQQCSILESNQTGEQQITSPFSQFSSLSMNTIDRFVLRQSKKVKQHAHVLFCGGPIASIAACPRALSDGRELFCVATIADEKNLSWSNQDANLQIWTLDPTENNKAAKLAFLLRVPKTQQICSLEWCPLIDNAYFKRKESELSEKRQRLACTTQTASTSEAYLLGENIDSNGNMPPLGLLGISTNNGRIHIYSFPNEIDRLVAKYQQGGTSSAQSTPLVLETVPLLTLCHPEIPMPRKNDEPELMSSTADSSIPLLSLKWSPFVGARHVTAISPAGFAYVWDILRSDPSSPILCLQLDGWQAVPMAISWMDRDKVCVTSRHRHLRVYKLTLPKSRQNEPASSTLLFECDTYKSVGTFCSTRPLIFPGLVSFDTQPFNYLGNPQQAVCYIWPAQIKSGFNNEEQEEAIKKDEQICATNLSNCHQLRISSVCICPQSGMCASVGADGRLVCSLNGRMAPKEGLKRDTETFMHGRTLLQLIRHDKQKVARPSEKEQTSKNHKFCYSHADCCEEKLLEIRLGDCALLDQKNERASGRRAPEVCLDRRLEALYALDSSHNNIGLTFCGGESGLVFIVPCTL